MESLFVCLCSLFIHTAETSLDITSGNSCFQNDVRSLKKKVEQDQGGKETINKRVKDLCWEKHS